MGGLSESNPRAFGVMVTLAGVAVFVPDALVMRLVGGDMLALAFWRGLLAGIVLIVGNALLAPLSLPTKGGWFDGTGMTVILLNAAGVLSWCSAMEYTSAANALLVLATAPFIAAILSWLFLRESIDRTTGMAIGMVSLGVIVIASGSLGHGRLIGDLLALINAVTVAGYYVTLRKAGRRNMLPHLALGSMLGGVLALPFADFVPVDMATIFLIVLSGAVIVPLAAGLLLLGPRYLPAAEVSMITLLELILGPLLVWAVLGEHPGQRTLLGGAIIIMAVLFHALRRLNCSAGAV